MINSWKYTKLKQILFLSDGSNATYSITLSDFNKIKTEGNLHNIILSSNDKLSYLKKEYCRGYILLSLQHILGGIYDPI